MNINFGCNGSTLGKGFAGCITFIGRDDEKERMKIVRNLWAKSPMRYMEMEIILLNC